MKLRVQVILEDFDLSSTIAFHNQIVDIDDAKVKPEDFIGFAHEIATAGAKFIQSETKDR